MSQKLSAADGDAEDRFGVSVGLSRNGTTAVVGAFEDKDPNGEQAGAAYVFDRRIGSWTQQTKLVAADGDAGDWFGGSVTVSSDGMTAVIGAPNDDDPDGSSDAQSGAGSAYVFSQTGGDWNREAKLTAADGEPGDMFGLDVAVSSDGTTAIIGAAEDENPNGEQAGSAYVFEQSGSAWDQQAKLSAADGDADDHFGQAVALSDDGTTALVSAAYDRVTPEEIILGSVYAFERSDGTWNQQAKLVPGEVGYRVGSTVSLSADGTVALIGTSEYERPSPGAYVFEQLDGSWEQQAKLSTGDPQDWFGRAVALSADGTTALCSAHAETDPNGEQAGAAYVFDRSDGTWNQRTKLVAADGDSEDWFGWGVALSGDATTALVGALLDEDPHGTDSGSAYVFSV
ncbi:FG-GAP repeat protein [Halapricum hydrolyticum]|uniref:FG-GAP repeat protein n=1 Tax=Halapricum hydrolyticum TaxID=2979991 RepID=A0AAE3I9M9_9EURY|nr:FG-GAP repeat protein [Halapricum hydrolyticum]MCU4716464.1 FG-GAP repeat protein [Halapricum hydrolyticum]MCU4725932.1 FG-GAP repeat protein [Halapricum hydrolyticum]